SCAPPRSARSSLRWSRSRRRTDSTPINGSACSGCSEPTRQRFPQRCPATADRNPRVPADAGRREGNDMKTIRWTAMWTLMWTAKEGFELVDQIHNGWLLADSDHDLRI